MPRYSIFDQKTLAGMVAAVASNMSANDHSATASISKPSGRPPGLSRRRNVKCATMSERSKFKNRIAT